jgi:hypothetical protein
MSNAISNELKEINQYPRIATNPNPITTFMNGIHNGKEFETIWILVVENLEESEQEMLKELRSNTTHFQILERKFSKETGAFELVNASVKTTRANLPDRCFSVKYEGETFVSVPLMDNLVDLYDLDSYRKLIKSTDKELRIISDNSKKYYSPKNVPTLRGRTPRFEFSEDCDENSINEINE